MEKIKIILVQTVIVSFFSQMELVLSETINWIKGTPFDISWFIPGSIVLISFLSSLPTLMLYGNKPVNKRIARLKIVIHYLLLLAIVGGGGRLFLWYSTLSGFFQFTISFTIIYLLVWWIMAIRQKHDEKIINEALSKMRDED